MIKVPQMDLSKVSHPMKRAVSPTARACESVPLHRARIQAKRSLPPIRLGVSTGLSRTAPFIERPTTSLDMCLVDL